MTASFGVAEAVHEDDNMRSLHGRADRALYRVKRNGRNRVVRYRSGESGTVADTEGTG